MTVLTVDSSVWIDVLNGVQNHQTVLFQTTRDAFEVVIGDLVVAELLVGARDEAQASRIDRRLSDYVVVDMVGARNARTAARNYRQLRRLGVTISKPNDLFIATWCLEEGAMLLHRDRDFAPIEWHLGLRVLR